MKSDTAQQEPRVFRTLHEDFRRGDFASSMRQEFRDARDFMLDEQRKKRLGSMHPLKRWLYTGWWLLKSMFFKLTPARRLLLVVGIVLVMMSRVVIISGDKVRVQSDTGIAGTVCILFVLMLELKDKLIAKQELEAGRAVQQALMPEQSPAVVGWQLWLFTRSANEVGGDLVDFIGASEEHVGIVLGDVAGKGLRAALLTAKLQASIRALVSDFTTLDDLGRRLNHIFWRDSLRTIFASMVYCDIRPGSGDVRLLNAGHLPPLVVRKSGIESMPKGGAALGIARDASFTEQQVHLEPDELLCIYSDGLTEAQNESGEFLGEQRLHEFVLHNAHLAASELGTALVAHVDRFIGGARTHDDLSLVLMKYTS